jgi:hypothetical protein
MTWIDESLKLVKLNKEIKMHFKEQPASFNSQEEFPLTQRFINDQDAFKKDNNQ